MSNKYYIREQALDQKTIEVVIHINIPAAGNNSVGVQWREALLSHLKGADNISTVIPELVGTQEETDMKAGAVLEKSETYRFSALGLSVPEKQAEISAWYNNRKDEILADLQIVLQYIGYSS